MATDSRIVPDSETESRNLGAAAPGKPRRVDAERQSLAAILDLVRTGEAGTRQEIEKSTGLGRAVVTGRLSTLFELGLLEEGELGQATGGRAPRIVRFREQAGVILVSTLDQSRLGVGIADLSGRLLAEHHEAAGVAAGLAQLHQRLCTLFDWLIEQHRDKRDIWGIGLAAPGPVENGIDQPFATPKLHFIPAWDDYPITEHLQVRYRAPVWMRSGVQMMAYGEFKSGSGESARDVIYVNLGNGISAGIISDGRLHRGALGGAGLIGHTVSSDDSSMRCSCGNTGCLETLAGGEAIVQEGLRLAQDGRSPYLAETLEANAEITAVDVGLAAQSGDTACAELLARCGRLIGTAVAALVNAFNPALIVLGGDVGQADDILLAAIREAVYRRSHPLVTRDLRIVRSAMGNSAGLAGSALMVADALFEPASLGSWIGFGSPHRTPDFEDLIAKSLKHIRGAQDRPRPPAH